MNFERSLRHALHPRRFIRLLFRLLSKERRYRTYRRLLKVTDDLGPEYVIKIAETKTELQQAYSLLYKTYLSHGYTEENLNEMRVTPYHAIPSTVTVVVKHNDLVVATLSIIRDSVFGFPSSELFDIEDHVPLGSRVAEISSLAVHKSYRDKRGLLLFPMFKYMQQYCIRYFGVDCLVAVVNPKHVEFYESILNFGPINAKTVSQYDFANGAPAVGLYLDLRKLPEDYQKLYEGAPNSRNLHHFFVTAGTPDCYVFPEYRRYYQVDHPVLTPELLKYFFVEASDVFAKLTESQLGILLQMYDHPDYQEILPRPGAGEHLCKRSFVRFEVDAPARYIDASSVSNRFRVLNVSFNGFKAFFLGNLVPHDAVSIDVKIGDFEIISLKGELKWSSDTGLCGFEVKSPPEAWVRFIARLYKDLHQMQYTEMPVKLCA